ncbi:hypothetical protein ABH968_000902 [Lysinibacillus sp. RC79]
MRESEASAADVYYAKAKRQQQHDAGQLAVIAWMR